MQDTIQHISYGRILSRRLRKSESAVTLLAGTSLLNPKKVNPDQSPEMGKESAEALGAILSGYPVGAAERQPIRGTGVKTMPNKSPQQKLYRLSYRTRKKIREKSQAFIQVYGVERCTFLTLTFIGTVDDCTAVSILNKFQTRIRQKYGNFEFIRVAERQDGKRNGYSHCTGNIHFHLLVNRRLPVQEINGLWIRQQYRAGISHPAIEENIIAPGFKVTDLSDQELAKFLNPVDIDDIKDAAACAGYLVKYMAKSDDVFEVQIFQCSKAVSALATGIALTQFQYRKAMRLSTVTDKATPVNMRVNRDGELIEARTTCVYDKQDRFLAAVTPVINIDYFNKNYLHELKQINRIIVDKLEDFRKRRRTLDAYRVSRSWYMTTFQLTNPN